MVLQETPFVRSSMDGVHTSRVHDSGEASVMIRACDAWMASLIAAWVEQRMVDLEPAMRAQTRPRPYGFIGDILRILVGNIEVADSATDDEAAGTFAAVE